MVVCGGDVDGGGGGIWRRRENERVRALWYCIIRGKVTNKIL